MSAPAPGLAGEMAPDHAQQDMAEAGAGLDGFRLAPRQQRRWTLAEAGHLPARQRAVVRFAWTGAAPDRAALEAALNALVARHEILRASFRRLPGMRVPLQVACAEARVSWLDEADHAGAIGAEVRLPGAARGDVTRDVTSEPGAAPRASARTDRALGIETAFDGAPAAPAAPEAALCATLDAAGLTLSLPAACADGPTLLRLGAELAAGLSDTATAPDHDHDAAPLQFFDLAQWQHDLLAEEGSWHWPDPALLRFAGPWPALPALRATRSGATPRYRAARESCPLAADSGAQLGAACARLGVTAADLLVAVWAVLLRRLAGGETQPVALVVDGRPFDELAGALGPLAVPVPLPLATALAAPDASFATLARAVAEAREHAADRCHHLVAPDSEHFVPFPVEVSNAALPAGAPLRVAALYVAGEPALLKLSALVGPGDALAVAIDHHADAVCDSGAMRLAEQFATLLAGALADPDAQPDAPDLLGAAERQRVTVAFQGPCVDHGPWRPVHLAVSAMAEAQPQRLAVQDGTARVTAAALEHAVRALAARLVAAGVGPDTPVVLHLPRGLALVTAMLAVLHAGGAYLPMPPDLPAARRRTILADSGARIVLTPPALARELPADAGLVLIDPAADAPDAAAADAATAPAGPAAEAGRAGGVAPHHAAYILYTSGSTGRPKGVVVTHGALANHMAWMTRAFPLGADDAVLQKTAAGFDASVWEFFLPLMGGARLVMAPPGLERDVPALVATLARERISVLQVVPSLLRALVDEAGFAACGTLRQLFCGGEALTPELARRFAALHRAALINLYGPTETTIQVCAQHVDPADDTVPVGRPIDNVRVLVVDARGRPVPIGMRGEIVIGGAAPARGYLHAPALTAERFVAEPLDTAGGGAARAYRSGDQGAWRPDGRLDLFGRVDDQVKLRGYRIELGEVEAALARHPDVASAAARVDTDAGGHARLVCAYACRADRSLAPAALRDWLAGQLPDYMVPGICRRLDALPLNASGKLDRAALAIGSDASADAGAPRDPVELRLERIWEAVLDVQPVGVERNFFELGGHSLLAVRLMAEIRREFGCELPLASLFQAPTVAAQAALIRARAPSDPVVIPVHRGSEGERPLFLVHPTGGNVLCYRELARRLGSTRPIYALQDPGLEGVASYASVEELAALHLARIRPLAGEGPYYLAGWSSGGVVAFEMARQLLARGEEVGMLALIDSVAASGPDSGPRAELDLIGSIGRLLAYSAGIDAPDLSRLTPAAAMAQLRALAVAAGTLPPDASPERMQRLFEVFRRNVDAVRRYRPGPYPRRLLLLRATQPLPEAVREAAAGQRDAAPDLGWARVAVVSRRDIPAHHLSIVREPAVALVGAAIRDALQAADRIEAISEQVFFTLLGH